MSAAEIRRLEQAVVGRNDLDWPPALRFRLVIGSPASRSFAAAAKERTASSEDRSSGRTSTPSGTVAVAGLRAPRRIRVPGSAASRARVWAPIPAVPPVITIVWVKAVSLQWSASI